MLIIPNQNTNRVFFAERPVNIVNQFSIVNKAKPGEYENDGVTIFSEFRIPIKAEEETKNLVERDLLQYFKSSLSESEKSSRKVYVTIYRADAYQATKANGTYLIPIVGIFTGFDSKIGINLKILVEIEDHGKLVKEFAFDRRVEVKTKPFDSLEEQYKQIITHYREQLFTDLDRNVVRFMLESHK